MGKKDDDVNQNQYFECIEIVRKAMRECADKNDDKSNRNSLQESVMDRPIEELGLSLRATAPLRRSGLFTIGDLCAKTSGEMMGIRNWGRRSFEEVVQALKERGLHFKDVVVDENGDEVKWLRGYPENVTELALKKPDLWEYRLLIEATLYHDSQLAELKKQAAFGFDMLKKTGTELKFSNIKEAFTFIVGKWKELEDTNPRTNAEVVEAMGKPGEDGDAQKIIQVSRKIVKAYEELLNWKIYFKHLYIAEKLYRPAFKFLLNGADDMMQCFELFFTKMRNAKKYIQEYLEEKITAEELEEKADMSVTIAGDFEMLKNEIYKFLVLNDKEAQNEEDRINLRDFDFWSDEN